MVKVSRSDVFIRSEKGGMWFDEFLRTYDVNKTAYPTSIQEIIGIITNKRGETVESVVQKYREQVGLDIVQSSTNDSADAKMLSCATRPISIRHATEYESVVEKIQSNESLRNAIESLCKHSGGHKSVQSLINFIRGEIGNDVSFSDDHLTKYLTECKNKFKSPEFNDNTDGEQVGLIGLKDDTNMYDDDVADYMANDSSGTK